MGRLEGGGVDVGIGHLIPVSNGDTTILHRDQRSLGTHTSSLLSGEYGDLFLRW